MKRRRLRKVTIAPTTMIGRERILKVPTGNHIIPHNQPKETGYKITPSLYQNNEDFHNSLKSNYEKTKFLKSLNHYAEVKYQKAILSDLPIINMVFFGHWGWVFSNMVKIYEEKAKGKYIIISSVWPLPNCDVYQYWRIGNTHSREYFNNIGLHNKKHEVFARGVQMFHDSPYHESRFNTSYRRQFLNSFNSLLCTSKEQYDWVSTNNLHSNQFYIPLGTDDRFKEKNKTSSAGKIKIGFIGRLYGCGFKGEKRIVSLAKLLDPSKFEFVFLSPNAGKIISEIIREGFNAKEITSNNPQFLDAYKSIDVTLILSTNEGTPLPLIESLKLGHTVISTKVGEAPLYLESEYLLDKQNPELSKAANLLNRIYDDRSILNRNKSINVLKASKLSWDRFCKESFKLWDKIIPKKKSGIISNKERHITFLSWHNSLPGYIKKLYETLSITKSFISVEEIKPPRLLDKALMSNHNSYVERTLPEIVKRLTELNTTHIVVWNGEFNDNERGHQPRFINYIKNHLNVQFIYAEHGWFPQKDTFMLDKEGTNGSSSIAKSTHVPISKSNKHNTKRKEYDKLAIDPKIRDYIYVPLQLNTDTQIVNHSPFFKDMVSFINHVARLFNKKIIVKVHPKDTAVNKEKYRNACNRISNVRYVEDTNNIGWCKFASYVIAINSTSINEALLYRKPVMTYGINNFYDKGVTYCIKDVNDIEYQKNFLDYTVDIESIDNYINYLLSLQFSKNNPDMNKANKYFS